MLNGKMGSKMGMLLGLFVHGKRESESACVRALKREESEKQC